MPRPWNNGPPWRDLARILYCRCNTSQTEDAELMEDIEYLSMGEKPADRVKTSLGKLDSMRRSKERGYNISEEIRHPSNKFILAPLAKGINIAIYI